MPAPHCASSARTPKQPATLNRLLDRRLLAYAAAATAGITVLSAAEPAQAKVIFTNANETIVWGKTKLDLNHDGINDFEFAEGGLGHFINDVVGAGRQKSNRIFGGYFASALSSGVTIGPNKKFFPQIEVLEQLFTNSFGTNYLGPWVDAKNRFLGLEFKINGQPHFGWARITFTGFGSATITGYAYETVPNKAIVAGDTGSDRAIAHEGGPEAHAPEVRQASLGHLAQGAQYILMLRKDVGVL